MTQTSCIKILVLGAKCVGKSAITVRFLTKRYIGEYKSNTDWFYQQRVKTDDGMATDVEILDISKTLKDKENMANKDQIEWAEAFVIIYSICDRNSFNLAQHYLRYISAIRGPVYVPIILIANKRDLEVGRQVSVEEGTTLALQFGSQFYEISAADSNKGVSQAFEWLLHESHKTSHKSSSHSNRSANHRKLSIVTVTRVFSAFGHVFGKSHNNSDDNNNNHNDSNGNILRQKNHTNYALNTRRKIANVMIPVVRRSAKPVISL